MAGSMLVGGMVYLPKIHRAARASSSSFYLDWKHISAWDVIVKSAVNRRPEMWASGHGSDHVVLRLTGVACSSNMSPKGSSQNPNWVIYESSAAVFFKDWFHSLLHHAIHLLDRPKGGQESSKEFENIPNFTKISMKYLLIKC